MNPIFTTSNCLSRQQITDYLTEQADRATIRQIENHLLDCPLCANAVEGFAQQANVATAIRQTQDLDYANRTATVRWLSPLKNVASIAALIAISLGGWWVFQQNQSTLEQLFAQHFTTYENDVTLSLRSNNDRPTEYAIETNPLHLALMAYDEQNFAQSITLLQARLAERPQDGTAAFYLGLSYLETNELEKAADYLVQAKDRSARYREAATWYLALAQLKMENVDTAKSLLQELLQAKDEFYAKRATALITDL